MHACLCFRLREEAGVPVQNLRKHQENIQTSHRKLVAWIMFHVVYFNPYMFSYFQFMSCKIFILHMCAHSTCVGGSFRMYSEKHILPTGWQLFDFYTPLIIH